MTPSVRFGFLLLLAALGAAAWVRGEGAGAAGRARVRWPAALRGDLIVKELMTLVTPPPGSGLDEHQVLKVIRYDDVVFRLAGPPGEVTVYETWGVQQQTGKVTVLHDAFAHWTATNPETGGVCGQTGTLYGKLEGAPIVSRPPSPGATLFIGESSEPGLWLVSAEADEVVEGVYTLTNSCGPTDPSQTIDVAVTCFADGILHQVSVRGRRGFILKGQTRLPSPDGSSQYIRQVKGTFVTVQARQR